MPTLNEHPSSTLVKMLNIGESSTGKTGALVSLVVAGYTLWVLDYDNGLDIVGNTLRDPLNGPYRDDPAGLTAALGRVHFETLRDEIILSNGLPKVKAATAYKECAEVIKEWDIANLTSNDVLVLDTLTTFSDAAFNQALAAGQRLNQRPQLQDYGWMADSVKLFIEMITDSSIPCHVIVNTHIRYFSGDEEEQTRARGLPNARGQEISRIVSRYFNTVVLTRSVGSGAGTKRQISTQPQGVVEVKTSAPSAVKATYPIESGLAALFKDILGTTPSSETPK